VTNRPTVGVAGQQLMDVGVYGSNPNLASNQTKIDIQSSNSMFYNNLELSQGEEDERYRYLLKNGIVRRVEDEDKMIFAELP
jgi:hypothetical protein